MGYLRLNKHERTEETVRAVHKLMVLSLASLKKCYKRDWCQELGAHEACIQHPIKYVLLKSLTRTIHPSAGQVPLLPKIRRIAAETARANRKTCSCGQIAHSVQTG
jgi:hypothetical protein